MFHDYHDARWPLHKEPIDEDGITINFPFSRTRNQIEQEEPGVGTSNKQRIKIASPFYNTIL
jgi:hypothetical protein